MSFTFSQQSTHLTFNNIHKKGIIGFVKVVRTRKDIPIESPLTFFQDIQKIEILYGLKVKINTKENKRNIKIVNNFQKLEPTKH